MSEHRGKAILHGKRKVLSQIGGNHHMWRRQLTEQGGYLPIKLSESRPPQTIIIFNVTIDFTGLPDNWIYNTMPMIRVSSKFPTIRKEQRSLTIMHPANDRAKGKKAGLRGNAGKGQSGQIFLGNSFVQKNIIGKWKSRDGVSPDDCGVQKLDAPQTLVEVV